MSNEDCLILGQCPNQYCLLGTGKCIKDHPKFAATSKKMLRSNSNANILKHFLLQRTRILALKALYFSLFLASIYFPDLLTGAYQTWKLVRRKNTLYLT